MYIRLVEEITRIFVNYWIIVYSNFTQKITYEQFNTFFFKKNDVLNLSFEKKKLKEIHTFLVQYDSNQISQNLVNF